MDNKVSILSTAALAQPLITKVAEAGFDMDIVPFIKVQFKNDTLTAEQVNAVTPGAYVVFTSSNAVNAVAGIINGPVNWKIFCVGDNTALLADQYFNNGLIASSDTAATLTSVILQHKDVKEVTFFCTGIRRDELPDTLRDNEVTVNELIVYTTIATPEKKERDYNAILFFSPSAVESFFSVNKVDRDAILFAIGNTTAAALKTKATNTIITSASPGKEQLVDELVKYYTAVHKNI